VWPLGITRDGSIYYSAPPFKSGPKDLWVMEGFLTSKVSDEDPSNIRTEIPPEELIIGADGSILDKKLGFTGTLPDRWTLRYAVRRGSNTSLLSFVPTIKIPNGSLVGIAYRSTTPWENARLTVYPMPDLGPKHGYGIMRTPWNVKGSNALGRFTGTEPAARRRGW
jgi:hypothetical protein